MFAGYLDLAICGIWCIRWINQFSECWLCEMTHTQEPLSVSNSLPSMADMTDPPACPLGATDTTDDSEDEDSEMDDWEPLEPQTFNPHNLCKWWQSSHAVVEIRDVKHWVFFPFWMQGSGPNWGQWLTELPVDLFCIFFKRFDLQKINKCIVD